MKHPSRSLRQVVCLGLVQLAALASASGATAAEEDAALINRIGTAPVFARPIVWVGLATPRPAETRALWDAIQQMQTLPPEERADVLEVFIKQHPYSPWTPSLRTQLAKHYRERGRHTLAMQHWDAAWNTTQALEDARGKEVADYTLAHWSRLLASLGRRDHLSMLMERTSVRPLDRGPLQQLVNRSKDALSVMRTNSPISYRCGTFALAHASGLAGGRLADLKPIMQIPSPDTGFTMKDLQGFTARFKLDLVPARRPASDGQLVVPCVVHWKQNHYAAIVDRRGDQLRVVDPTFGSPVWLHAKDVNAEASGVFMVPKDKLPKGWKSMTDAELGQVFGKGYPNSVPDETDCPSGDDSCSAPGMPTWRVSEPFITLWFSDTPFRYAPSKGDTIELNLRYKQRDDRDPVNVFGTGPLWNNNWLSYVEAQTNTAVHRVAGGGQRTYDLTSSAIEWDGRTRMTQLTNGFRLQYTGGAREDYTFAVSNLLADPKFFLTERVTARGHVTRFNYELTNSMTLLRSVVDADGKTNVVRYSASSPTLIAEVENPFGYKVTLRYDSQGLLTNIVDVVGLSSSFTYNIQGIVNELKTPYGSTRFQFSGVYADELGGNKNNRTVLVTAPDGSKQFYAYRDNSQGFHGYTTSDYPDSLPAELPFLGNEWMYYRNSFHWGPRQFEALSAAARANLFNLSSNDYRIAHWKHFHHYPDGSGGLRVGKSLHMERLPSANPATGEEGTKIWYGRMGTDENSEYRGDNNTPTLIAKQTAEGGWNWKWLRYDASGNVTNTVESFSINGTMLRRTNVFEYSTNGVDLLRHVGPDGTVLKAVGYSANHQPLSVTNAVGDVTSFTYDTNGLLTSVATPAGLTTTNLYGADGRLATTIDLEIGRTNSFTYTNGLIYTHTDARGLTVTNTWDALERLTSVIYPDGTTLSNVYDKLDVGATKDRLGNWTYFGHNAVRQRTAVTNALGAVTRFTWCSCGSPETVMDPEGGVVTMTYDLNSRLVRTLLLDGSYTTNIYNRFGQLINVRDSAGLSVTNWYDNQGLLTASSNRYGRVLSLAYDLHDRPTNVVDASGISVALTYDAAGRVVARSYPDGGVERFGHSARGMVAHTNQTGKVTRFGYDPAGRKFAETNANNEVVYYTYSAAGDLLNLSDAKAQNTWWGYDALGRVTNKVDHGTNTVFTYGYDAGGRLTNRWSAGKGSTAYRYDAGGHLTNVVYPVSAALAMGYDRAGRLTNLVDGVGTTKWTYTMTGQLASEDGPWSDDTVSYSYTGRQRTGLSLQQPGTAAWTQSYAYDLAKRLTNITSGAGTFTYRYHGGGGQVRELALPNGAVESRLYDAAGRVRRLAVNNSYGTTLDYHSYYYDLAGLRKQETRLDGSQVAYDYDAAGQLTAAKAFYDDGTVRPHEWSTWGYDAAGNLTNRVRNALNQSFSVNSLNQLVSGSRSGTLTVAGLTSGTVTNVTVNGQTATRYRDGTFAKAGFSLSDGTNAFTAIATDSGGASATNAVNVNLPESPSYVYDANGNLTSDGTKGYEYDDENQLTRITVTNAWKSEFSYDGKMRRRVRKEFTWTGGAWVLTEEVRYVYDGKLVIEERDGSNVPLVTFTRGNGLSGGIHKAGGIGGLLGRTARGATNSHAFYHADGNGNVTVMLDASQSVVARYLYDPFGQAIAQWGPLATENLYRFSSKEAHERSGLVYYLYRYYAPHLQRWMNRDPIGEIGGINIYSFCNNDSVNCIDPNGWFMLFGFTGAQMLRGALATTAVSGLLYGGYRLLRDPIAIHNSTPIASTDLARTVTALNDMITRIPGMDPNIRTKIEGLIEAIRDGDLNVRLINCGMGGRHVNFNNGTVYISDQLSHRSSLELALTIFAEFQHDISGGSLSESDAQDELEVLLRGVRQAYPAFEITDYINNMRHGGR